MDPQPGTSWSYANNLRMATMFLGLSMISTGLGVLLILSFGSAAAEAASTFLILGTFVVVFAVLVFVPRLIRRGASSFSLYANTPLEEAERAVRDALSGTGANVHVEVVKSKSRNPSRIVFVDGRGPRFRIQSSRSPQGSNPGGPWTEVIQSGVDGEGNDSARELRERVSAKLQGPQPPSG